MECTCGNEMELVTEDVSDPRYDSTPYMQTFWACSCGESEPYIKEEDEA